MRRYGAVTVLLGLLTAAPAAGQGRAQREIRPGLQITALEERYPVAEERLADVIDALNHMRLEGERGPLSQGLTVYEVVPRWRYQPASGSCSVITAEVRVEITVKLPMWPGFAKASGDDRFRWRAILEGIREHEYEHRDVTILSAEELLDDLFGLRARTCGALNRAAEGATALADEALRSRHAEIDGSG
ncbi:MAG TPA: DUF922 domain-containing protein [Gemmatimonadetes bacterium]|jgi:predicted secreted Zn-dependent protease|nr:DUF922 domain-containing protein [Gemmatimonadota bacterium]